MTHVFPFHGTLSQSWDVFYSEYRRLSKALGRQPFEFESPKHSTIHEYVPKDGDEIIINFRDADRKQTLLVVEAEIIPDEDNGINIFVHPQGNPFEEPVKSAMSIWKEIRSALKKAGIGMRSEQLPKPKSGADLIIFFDRYHQEKNSGRKYTLKQVAEETGFGYLYVRQLHSRYLKERGLVKPEKRTNKRTNKN